MAEPEVEQIFYILDGNNEIVDVEQIIVEDNYNSALISEVEIVVNNADNNPLAEQQLDNEDIILSPKLKSRKRQRNTANWKSNIRKRKYPAGVEYKSFRGKVIPSNCKYLCAQKVSEAERVQIFNSFYSLDSQRKHDYILKTTSRNLRNRKTTNKQSRRAFSFAYYIEIGADRFMVCKNFYLGTLNISQTSVYNVHQKNFTQTGTSQTDMRGRISSKKIPQEIVDDIMKHINSFARITNHIIAVPK